MRHSTRLQLAGLLLAGFGTACIFVHAEDDSMNGEHAAATGHHHGARATSTIEAKSGSSLTGSASFVETEGGVLIELEVHHAPPGWHAVHVHEKGDCSAADGTSAGGHFNPGNMAHGAPHALAHHAGDLGNMWVDEKGEGRHVLLMPELTVAAGPYSVVGRALVVHATNDDLTTQPTGNAGGRIGCGVIR